MTLIKEDTEVEESKMIYDLIYDLLSRDERKLILQLWPDAKFEDSWDYIHEHRTSVQFQGKPTEWLKFLLEREIADISLYFQFQLLRNPESVTVK